MKSETTIIIAEDNEGHVLLVKKNLRRAGIKNEILHFSNGQDLLDFLFQQGENQNGKQYLLLLDIRMPKVDGIEVLRQIKQDKRFQKMPVIMLTTTDNPQEIDRCYELGCNVYITKPVDYEKFMEAINRLGLFIMVIEVPKLPEMKPSGEGKNGK
ncbi:TPA: response regulator [Candidatus Poribacteria bacterium]|nr:response regulator [Candidatus Poribacteria bacterium]